MCGFKHFGLSLQGVAALGLALAPSVCAASKKTSPTALFSNVRATNVTATTATITWTTSLPADTQVAYVIGSAKPTWSACCKPVNVTSHSLTLAGLTPNTAYNFFVESTPTGSSTPVDSAPSTFRTAAGFSISHVVATDITATSAAIAWTTSLPADTQVAYFIGSARPTWSACCNPVNVTSHSLTLSGLTPNTVYNFFVESTPSGSSTPVDSAPATFDTLSSIAKDFGPGQRPNLVVDTNGNVDLSFLQVGPAGNVVFARSIDGGSNFAVGPVATPGPVTSVAMGVDGQGVIDLLWQSEAGGSFFANSIDGGKTFLRTDISSLISTAIESSAPNLNVSSNGLIDLSQLANSQGRKGMVSVVLTNRGTSSQTPVQFSSNVKDVDSGPVSAAGAQGQIYVAWQMQNEALPQCDIMFSRSLDGGVTFSTPLSVSNHPNECGEFPQLFVDSGGGVNIAWTTPAGFSSNNGPIVNPNELYFARSTDQGATFSTPTALVGINQFTGRGDDFSGVGDPQIAVEQNGAIDVVFDANTLNDMIALFARSTDGGATFSTPVTLATGGANSPVVAIDGCGGINVAWAGNTGPSLSRSADGITFTTPTNLSNTNKAEFDPVIVTDVKGSAYIVWEDLTDVFFQRVKVCP